MLTYHIQNYSQSYFSDQTHLETNEIKFRAEFLILIYSACYSIACKLFLKNRKKWV